MTTIEKNQLDSIISHEFQLQDDLVHLNHAAVGPWPLRTVQAISDFAQENLKSGSQNYLRWIETETALRKDFAALINAPSHTDIALVKNTSEALSFVAYGIPWNKGDNVVITDQEFPFNHVVWESLASKGVELRIAKTQASAATSAEQNIIDSCDKNTRLVSVSSIQYASGLRLNLQKIGEYCRNQQILFCVDAIQSIGVTPFDVQQIQADFVMADGHKWMLAPEGLGFFYCRANQRESLTLNQYGWHMLENMGDYQDKQWQVAHSARRFECGSPNMLGVHALKASISLLLEIGMETIFDRIRGNTELMLQQVQQREELELISPASSEHLGGIVTFKHRGIAAEKLYGYLQNNNVICAMRGGGVRFSPHFYTSPEIILRGFKLIDNFQDGY